MSNQELGLKELEKAQNYLRLANQAQERGLTLIGSAAKKVKKVKNDFSEDVTKRRLRNNR